MKPKIRCMRYGEDRTSPRKPAAIITSKPPNHLPFMPPRNSACRSRKYADLPPVNLLASAIAIEEEYTITIPTVSRRSAAHSTPLSYSASGARPGLMLRSIDDSFHRQAKSLSPMPVVTEHVEARAGGRKGHRIARGGPLRGQRHRLVPGRGAPNRGPGARAPRLDQRRGAAD